MAGYQKHPIPLTSSRSSSDKDKGFRVRSSMKLHQPPYPHHLSDGGGEGLSGGNKHDSAGNRGMGEDRNSRLYRNRPPCNEQDLHYRSGHRHGEDAVLGAQSSGTMRHLPACPTKAEPISIEPISIVPMEDRPEPINACSGKRPAENGTENGEASTLKKVKREEEESYKIVRKWGEMDEIALLNGILEFQSKNGIMLSGNSTLFYEFIKDRFGRGMTKIRMMEKVRRMKERHIRNQGKSKGSFSSHEAKCFKLSNKIWGNLAEGNATNSSEGDEDVNGGTWEKEYKSAPNGSTTLAEQEGEGVPLSHPTPEQTRSSSPAIYPILPKNHEEDPEIVVDKKVVNARQDEVQYAELYPNLMKRLYLRAGESSVDIVLKNLSLFKESDLKKMDREWEKHDWTEMEIYVKHASMTLNLLKSLGN